MRVLPRSPWTAYRLFLAKLLIAASALGLGACASLPDNVERPVSHAFNAPGTTPLGRLVVASQPAGASGSGFALLGQADSAYTSRISMVDAAQKSLDLQYYAIKQDASTDALLARVRAAAQRGVRVRILLDDLNASGRDAHVLRLMADRNIEIRMFNPLPGMRGSMLGRILGSLGDVDRIQQRMHNKVFIADGALAITGGRNIGDAYFGQGQDSNFVDLDILAAGAIVGDLSRSFDAYWNNKLAYPVESLLSQSEMEKLLGPVPEVAVPKKEVSSEAGTTAQDKTPAPKPPLPDTPSTIDEGIRTGRLALTWAPALMLVDKPGKLDPDKEAPPEETQDTLVDGLLRLMARARGDLLIVSPYFVPGPRMMEEFAALRKRNVRVRVLTNSLASNDAPIAHVGYARYRHDLIRMGVELYEMRAESQAAGGAFGSSGLGASADSRASLHAKTIVMDDRILVVGSMNLDLRSQLQNSEVALLIRSVSLSRAARDMIEPTLERDAWRMALDGNGKLLWRAPPKSGLEDERSEPGASTGLQIMLKLVSPFAPDEML
ncbi:phospholipase D family protein [Variovorax sp. VNK109]|uniref:phospholipase D family protein n=1 Tax=Variovorax sp. VNK109 TaxID=3400919 RepID=UPI003C02D698